MYKVIARHWVYRTPDRKEDIVIAETYDTEDDTKRRFCGTICGYRNWRLCETNENLTVQDACELAVRKAKTIRERIISKDDSVFILPQAW